MPDVKSRWKRDWEPTNPILRLGEPGHERDSGKLKLGDGKTRWLDLPYVNELPGRLSEEALRVAYASSILRRDDMPVIGRALAVDGDVPTVTFSASQTIAGSNVFSLKRQGNVTGADADLAGDTTYAVGGTPGIIANPSSPNNRTRAQFITGGSGQAARYTPTFRFMCDAAAFEYEGGIIGNTFMYRLNVDGRRSVVGTTLATTGGYGYVKFDFGSAKTRMIDLTIVDPDFNTIRVASIFGLWRPPQGYSRRLIVIGDSMTGGASGVDRHLVWLWDLAAALGCDDVWNVGIGGTGWVADGSGTTRYSGRVSADIAPLVQSRDVVLFFGSRNDPSGNQSQINALSEAVRSTLELIPDSNSNVYVAGPITNIAGNGAAVAAGALTAGRPYIDSTGWITGTGRSGATNGSGNADRYIGGADGSDSIHPTAAGHLYLARRWNNSIRALLPV